jgi:hypothetical protein
MSVISPKKGLVSHFRVPGNGGAPKEGGATNICGNWCSLASGDVKGTRSNYSRPKHNTRYSWRSKNQVESSIFHANGLVQSIRFFTCRVSAQTQSFFNLNRQCTYQITSTSVYKSKYVHYISRDIRQISVLTTSSHRAKFRKPVSFTKFATVTLKLSEISYKIFFYVEK